MKNIQGVDEPFFVSSDAPPKSTIRRRVYVPHRNEATREHNKSSQSKHSVYSRRCFSVKERWGFCHVNRKIKGPNLHMNTATNVLNELLGPVNLQVIISSTLFALLRRVTFCRNTRLTLRFNLIPGNFTIDDVVSNLEPSNGSFFKTNFTPESKVLSSAIPTFVQTRRAKFYSYLNWNSFVYF